MKSIAILGRQPELSLAELESLYGENKITPVEDYAAIVDIDPCEFNLKRIGGTIKYGMVLNEINSNKVKEDILPYLAEVGTEKSKLVPPGKLHLGISVYGYNLSPSQVTGLALELKKTIRKTGRNVQVVPNKQTALSSAQIIANKLTTSNGWEILIIRNGSKTIIGLCMLAQDINDYASRDQQRPFRDTKVGMLPPKLAQIIINLSVGNISKIKPVSVCVPEDKQSLDKEIETIDQTILDPFCGSGVILQEAYLMGYTVMGSDIDERMVEFTKNNIQWLKDKLKLNKDNRLINLNNLDAQSAHWPTKFNFIASELYLGAPMQNNTNMDQIATQQRICQDIANKFLLNLKKQIKKSPVRICLALPVWRHNNDIIKLSLLDSTLQFNYNIIKFVHPKKDLIYIRENQFVGRQLIILENK